MKTAVQIAVEKLEQFIPPGNQLPIRLILDECLEIEKQQIINSCWYGHDIKHEYFNPIHYIDKTYPQNK
jgi:hypothetical protein